MAKRIVIEKSYVAQFIIYLPSLKRVLWSLVHLKFQSTKVKVAFGWINWQVHDPSLQPISLASLWAQFSEDKNSSPFCSVFLVMIICPGKIKSASVYGIRRMCKTNVIFWFSFKKTQLSLTTCQLFLPHCLRHWAMSVGLFRSQRVSSCRASNLHPLGSVRKDNDTIKEVSKWPPPGQAAQNRCLLSCVNQMKETEAKTDAWRKQKGRFPFSFRLLHLLRRLRPV